MQAHTHNAFPKQALTSHLSTPRSWAPSPHLQPVREFAPDARKAPVPGATLLPAAASSIAIFSAAAPATAIPLLLLRRLLWRWLRLSGLLPPLWLLLLLPPLVLRRVFRSPDDEAPLHHPHVLQVVCRARRGMGTGAQ